MKLAVFGATGGVGTQLVKLALEQGHTVTAVVRNPAKFTLPNHEALHLVTVPDLADTGRVQAAVSGSDAALSGVGPSTSKDVTAASVPTRHILTALKGAGIERFVAVSAAPVGPVPEDDSFLNKRVVYTMTRRFFAGIYGDLAVMEEDIAASGLRWTVVRPPKLTDKAIRDYRTVIGGNVPGGMFASRAEVADAMLKLLTDDRAVNQAVGVAR
ncbi:NAD(P)-dependent oxidoreductase [Actinophytocola sp.]|uniref:NAD(P)-dependent oxidoreductase n=1 Tax=Actinophytocola sp. TaxID=1872138 RepID=UPI00389AF3D4